MKISGNMENNIVENILKSNTRNINTNKTDVIPCNTNVILKFYENNPYRALEETEKGIFLGITGNKRYKSNETGEMEDSEEYIACAKVVAVGPSCKNVSVGEDVFAVKHIATPLPYRNFNYEVINEENIICRIKND